MAKLGLKARKFAKKNLQSVYKKNRKLKSIYNKRSSIKKNRNHIQEEEEQVCTTVRNKGNALIDLSLHRIFNHHQTTVTGNDSDSDGYLPEDSSLRAAQNEGETHVQGRASGTALSLQNNEIYTQLVNKTNKLNRLKIKDKEFSKFLESHDKKLKSPGNEDYSDDDEMSVDETELVNEDANGNRCTFLTSSAFDSLCELVVDQKNLSALTVLLNGYRTACHFGSESIGSHDTFDSSKKLQSSETCSKILVFMLREADNLFRKLIGLSGSNVGKEKSSELMRSPEWTAVKPMIRSYLRSTLFLMNQVTETDILVFSLNRARASISFFNAFPSLIHRLLKTALQLWATGGGSVSLHAFGIVQDIASLYTSDWFDTCFVETYKSFIGQCQLVEQAQLKHIQYMRNSFVDLCSVEVQKSSRKVAISIQHLNKVLYQGLQMNNKEALEIICSWQYISCIDIWVSFISANIQEYDLQPLLYMVIQIINEMTILFHGPRYLPLRVKCIQWLNHLSSSSGIFIPVASLILDVLECKVGEGGKLGKAFSLSSAIKVPKNLLKSRDFQEQCILSAIELLIEHFAQWSYHISFPELATIPLICLRKFHENTSVESFKRVVKRCIDQVEQNVEFIRKRRDDVGFSPKDQSPVESFLQVEKSNSHTPFTQYYKSVMEKAAAKGKITGSKKIKKLQKLPDDSANADVNGGES